MKKIRLVQKFGANTIFHRVGFVGGWLDVFFFLHTSTSELTVDPSYARSSLAPLGIKMTIIAVKSYEHLLLKVEFLEEL